MAEKIVENWKFADENLMIFVEHLHL